MNTNKTPPTSSLQAHYAISKAAEIAGAKVQSVRLYESRGLISPVRTVGGTRRYSIADIVRLKRIVELLEMGLNLAGIELVLQLEDENQRLWQALEGRSGRSQRDH